MISELDLDVAVAKLGDLAYEHDWPYRKYIQYERQLRALPATRFRHEAPMLIRQILENEHHASQSTLTLDLFEAEEASTWRRVEHIDSGCSDLG